MKFIKLIKSSELTNKELAIQQLANIGKEVEVLLGVVDELNFLDPVISQGIKNIKQELDIIKNHINQ